MNVERQSFDERSFCHSPFPGATNRNFGACEIELFLFTGEEFSGVLERMYDESLFSSLPLLNLFILPAVSRRSTRFSINLLQASLTSCFVDVSADPFSAKPMHRAPLSGKLGLPVVATPGALSSFAIIRPSLLHPRRRSSSRNAFCTLLFAQFLITALLQRLTDDTTVQWNTVGSKASSLLRVRMYKG